MLSPIPLPSHPNVSFQSTKTNKQTWHIKNAKLLLFILSAAAFFFFPVAVAVAVNSAPGNVTVPMTTMPVPLGARDKTSPPIVTTPPGVSVAPARTILLTRDAVVWNVEGFAPLIITALPVGDSEITWPSNVSAPPGIKVWLPISRFDCAFSVKVEEPTTKMGAGVVMAAVVVCGVGEAEGRVIASPPVVMALPGMRVWSPTTKPDAEFSAIFVPSRTMEPCSVELGALVCIAFTTITPPEGTDTTWPLIVAASPGKRVCEPIAKSEALSWLGVRSPKTSPGRAVGELCAMAGPEGGMVGEAVL